MRLTKIVTTCVALLMVAAMPLALTQSPAAAARPKHTIHLVGKEIRNTGRFVVAGKVLDWKRKPVKLLKAKGMHGHRTLYKKRRTTRRGHFRILFDGPIGTCWWIDVPAGGGYRNTVKFVGCIVAGGRTQASRRMAA